MDVPTVTQQSPIYAEMALLTARYERVMRDKYLEQLADQATVARNKVQTSKPPIGSTVEVYL